MYGVIVTAHGNYPSGIYSGLKLIAGEQENVRVADFVEGDGFDEIDGKIQKALDELKEYDGIFILTDIAGGTPFNRSVMLTAGRKDVRVFAGLNFQMLYTAATAMGDFEEAAQTVLDEAKNGVTWYLEKQEEKKDDLFDDGI